MGLSVGIIGLPNVGKSTLFNAIVGRQQALTAPYPFATIEPNVGVVDVPDDRLEKLHAALSKNPRSDVTSETPIVYSSIRFVDIAGLVKGAAEGQGLGNQFLSHIRDVDVILHVVRDFDPSPSMNSGSGPVVPRHTDSKNPKHDVEIVETELALKDLETKERTEKQKGSSPLTPDSLLLSKPMIYVVNVDERRISSRHSGGSEATDRISGDPIVPTKSSGLQDDTLNDKPSLFVCAKIEEEISRLSKNEQKEFLSVYGLKSSGLDRIITECFSLLGLISFFTAGKIEVRAWPLPAGSTAVRASAVIHSDFEKLFIRAEVIEWQKLAAAGSWQDAKEGGLVRTEGREYKIRDGAVCNFLIGR